MKTYWREFIVIEQPLRDKRRGHLFSLKCSEAIRRGFKPIGTPKFELRGDKQYGLLCFYSTKKFIRKPRGRFAV